MLLSYKFDDEGMHSGEQSIRVFLQRVTLTDALDAYLAPHNKQSPGATTLSYLNLLLIPSLSTSYCDKNHTIPHTTINLSTQETTFYNLRIHTNKHFHSL